MCVCGTGNVTGNRLKEQNNQLPPPEKDCLSARETVKKNKWAEKLKEVGLEDSLLEHKNKHSERFHFL